jgi:hypothetical protein
MNEEELKKGCGKSFFVNGVVAEYDQAEYDQFTTCEEGIGLCPTCQARLEGFQRGKLEQKKEGLFIMNGSNVDLRICETEAISEDEDEINQIGVIKSGCGLRVYPKDNSIYIEQLQKEIGGMK